MKKSTLLVNLGTAAVLVTTAAITGCGGAKAEQKTDDPAAAAKTEEAAPAEAAPAEAAPAEAAPAEGEKAPEASCGGKR